VGELIVGASGGYSTLQRPQVSTQYRLAWGDVRAGLARISVAPRVEATLSASGVTGRIRPAVAAAAVQLQQQSGTAWTTLSSALTDAGGTWGFPGALAPGAYRVRSAPGGGLVPGVSPTVVVP